MATDRNLATPDRGAARKFAFVSGKNFCSRPSRATLVACAAIFLIVLAASCRTKRDAPAAASSAGGFSYGERLGYFQGPCLAISNQHVAPGTAVTLVVLGETQKVQPSRSLEQTKDPKTCQALLEPRAAVNAKPGMFFYALEPGSVDSLEMGIGIVNAPASPAIVGGSAQVDLDRDGRREVFSSCATTEGIRFGVWTGKAYQGEPRWSAYEYLGYDLQPSCP